MTNRREFLQTGAAVSAFAVNGLVPRGAAAVHAIGATVSLQKAIYDDRYAESRRFAQTMTEHGVPVRVIENGDVTAFWYDELDLAWRQGPVAVAGLTQFGPMFVLERLAIERGMRLAMRIEHEPGPGGTLAHAFSAPRATIRIAEQLRATGLDWPALTGTLACRYGAASGRLEHAVLVTSGTRPRLESAAARESIIHYYTPRAVQQGYSVPLDGPLFSWVIAPAARA
jgi:hypothetical protein